MEYSLWVLAILAGFVVGRFSAPKERTPEEETCDFLKAQLEKEVIYYKKLTKTLSEENMAYRRQLNDRT